ncbi:hypothetical protein CR203_04705 [Salipaludibacillus neizhouensis]|uniref:Beta-lactamase-related domain-containing protein n=1 Tax=Salipaludibacillus neizhouensis TaxID=885475 RepID=A0A3A9KFG5_9BACI|nr:serine hydrolase [Salipaludibacillus neizhouensis]RKL69331.1 hypothetical protein CR203_04705 [Salipaludibacillus neizhouensis]
MNKNSLHPFSRSTKEEEGLPNEALYNLEKECKQFEMETCIIYRNNAISYTYEQKQGLLTEKHRLNSVTKSIVSSLVGIALEENKGFSIDKKLISYYDQIDNESMSQVTIGNLLTMNSGFKPEDWKQVTESQNWIDTTFSLSLEDKPGEQMNYNNIDSHILSDLIQKVTGHSSTEFLKEKLLKPMDIHDYVWEADPNDIPIGGYGIYLTPIDLLKYGVLIMQKGVWNNQQLIPASWVEEAVCGKVKTDKWKQQYGYHWWVSEEVNERQPSFFYAVGRAGKFIFIYPQKHLVVVFTGALSSKDSLLPYQWFVKYILKNLD